MFIHGEQGWQDNTYKIPNKNKFLSPMKYYSHQIQDPQSKKLNIYHNIGNFINVFLNSKMLRLQFLVDYFINTW